MATQRKRTAGAKREVDLTEMVKSGAQGAYEALQLYRSRSMRFKSKNEFAEAINVCSSGSITLLENGYENAGAELAGLFVDLLIELERPVNEETKNALYTVDDKFPAKSTHRIEYLKACIKWTISVGDRELGDPILHQRLADALWNINDKNAVYHYAAGEAPLAYSNKIEEKYSGDTQLEARSQALTLGVVNFLALENLRDANELFYAFKKNQKTNYPSLNLDNQGLVNFCDYLLQTCRRDATPLFKTLVNTYASTVDFDEAVPTLLMGPIASKFFGIKPKVNPMMSMLQSMMS
jgi:hypothetical protein